MTRHAWIGVLVIAACSKSSAPAAKTSDAAPAKAAAKPVDAAPVKAAPLDAAPIDAAPAPPADASVAATGEPAKIVARADGVGPLDGSEVPLDQLKTMFPGYAVEFVPADPDSELGEDHVEVSRGDDIFLEINGDRVTIDDVAVDTDFGVHVGDTYAAVVKAVGKLKCEDGGAYGDSTEAFVFCSAKKYGHYSFDFIDFDDEGSPKHQGSDLLENKKLLAGATLAQLVWSK